ncbi:AraC family transcriptional regulator [Spongiibacter sp. KMU-158]|uniref:AraC family transcriptional regulator n=1 Tax=Spongiibacter pelagi TaxID=2760804 RepID=A0A927C067_9GAMM|nr:translation initiation factor IF-2 N-terminal domain-containing protein [Spongiibacter pelagi]MBD2858294.1 AraC family transcriptional regulator [Spongiibacter pelagi]
MPNIVTLAYDHCYASSLACHQDLYFIANAHWRDQGHSKEGLFRWRTLSKHAAPVVTATGLRVMVDGDLEDLKPGSIIIIPGMNYPGSRLFSQRLASMEIELAWLRRQYQRGCIVCSHCTGSFILAETGLLDGRTATTSWWLADQFAQRYPKIHLKADQLVLREEACITGGASTAEQLTALMMVEEYMGPGIAAQTAKTLLVDTNLTQQAPYLTLQSQQQHNDPLVSAAQLALQKNLQDSLSLEQLAEQLGVSSRTLIRRFKQVLGVTPTSYSQNLRIETAKRLLETTGLPIEELILQVGYEDVSSFSRLFQRKTGMTPRAYRQKFSVTDFQRFSAAE